MFEVLYYCRLRRGEARDLQWSDIDWNNKLVSITKQANSVKDSQKYYELTPPKTSKSISNLPLTEVLYNYLVNLYNEKKKNYGFNDKFFVVGDIAPASNSRFSNRKNKDCELDGVPQIIIHYFRHSCASLLMDSGANITLVAKYLGHTKIDETLNTYSHRYQNRLDTIVNIIELQNS